MNYKKWVFVIGVILLALFSLSGIFLIAMHSRWGQAKILSYLTEALKENGWQASVKEIEGALPNELTLRSIHLQSPGNDVIAIDELQAKISLLRLLKKEIDFTQLRADGIAWTPGPTSTGPIERPKRKLIAWKLNAPHLKLTRVSIPHIAFKADIDGQIQIGRRLRMAFAKLDIRFPELAHANAQFAFYLRPSRQTQLKLDISSPSLNAISPIDLPFTANGEIHFYAKGPWDAMFGYPVHSKLKGLIRGQVDIDDVSAPEIVQDFAKGSWQFFSVWERSPHIHLTRIDAHNEYLSATGSISIDADGQISHTSLSLGVQNPHSPLPLLDAKFQGHLQMNEPGVGTLSFSAPRLSWDQLHAEQIQANLQIQKESAHLTLLASALSQPWEAQCDLLWPQMQSLQIENLSVHCPAAQIEGRLAIFPDFLFTGDLSAQISNLHQLNTPFYGSIDASIRLKIEDAKSQLTEIDMKGADLFYFDAQIEKAFFYANLTGSILHPIGHAYAEIQRGHWKTLLMETATIQTTSTDGGGPIQFAAEGIWKDPFELAIDGSWRYDQPQFFIQLQEMSGSLFGHPLKLTNPTSLKAGPQVMQLKDLSITIGDALLEAGIDKNAKDTTARLRLDHFPIDFLSINPLNLSVKGMIDLDANVFEGNHGASGTIRAKLLDVEIANLQEADPLRAHGHIDAKLENNRLACDLGLQVRGSSHFSLTADLPMTVFLHPFHANIQTQANASAHLAMKGQIDELLDFFDLGAHWLEGTCECDLSLSNDLSQPAIDGFCRLTNGRYENYYSGLTLQNIQAEIIGERNSLRLRSLTAQDSEKKGHLSLKGAWHAAASDRFPFQFDGEFSRLNVADIQWMRAEAGGTVQIIGNLDSARVNAQAAILETDLSIAEPIPHQLPHLQVKYINAPKPIPDEERSHRPKPYPIFLDLHVYAPNGIFVTGRGLSSEWKGNFQLGGTYTDIEAKGQLEMMEGKFTFAGRSFQLSEGSLTFSGRPHEMPFLNLAGQMVMQDLTILARLKGPINSPQISFQSTPALPMGSILAHLLFGQDFSQIDALQAAQLVNSLETFSGGASNVFENTRRSLGIDRLRIVATPIGPDGGESIALQVGKYVTRGVLVSVSQGPEGGSTNLGIEVDLTNGFIFQAESQQVQEQGKFTIKWNLNY